MAGEWASVPLCTIATVKSGKRLPLGQTLTSQRTPHPYVRLVDIDGNRIRKENMQYLEPSTHKAISRYIVRSGDVCLAIVGHTIGLVFQVEEHWDGANLTENAARLTDFRGADPTFVFSYLRSQLGQDLIKSRIVGSAQGKLPLYAIASFPIPLPPLAEQRAIASVLGALDDKIELNRRMNATLESMARALFQSWFIDFDPVRAKLDNRHPTRMDAETAAMFPDRFEDSAVGHIPHGWSIGTITDCCDRIHSGGTPRRDEPAYWTDGAIPWLTSGEVRQPMITATENFISELGLKESSAKWVPANSTVVALYGATAGQVSFLGTTATTNQAICSLIPKTGFEFFNYFVMRGATADMESKAVGSAQQNISKGIVEETAVVLPSSAILRQFNLAAGPLFGQWIENNKQSRTLATLRDTLLPKLLSGELSVAGLEAKLEIPS